MSRLDLDGVPGEAIYGGIDVEKFKPLPHIQRVAGRIVTVGRMLPHKGLHHLVEALSDQQELIIVGIPNDRGYLSKVLQKAGNKRVKVVKNATDEELVALLDSAQLAVFPSTRKGPEGQTFIGEPELFGQAPLEAMACGTPALVSDLGSFPEIALPGFRGLIFREGDVEDLRSKMGKLMSDVETCRQLGRKSLDHVKSTFTWDLTVERCLSAYERP